MRLILFISLILVALLLLMHECDGHFVFMGHMEAKKATVAPEFTSSQEGEEEADDDDDDDDDDADKRIRVARSPWGWGKVNLRRIRVRNPFRNVGRAIRRAVPKVNVRRISQGLRNVGRNIDKGARAIGRNVDKGARAIGRNVDKGARAIGRNVDRGVRRGATNVKEVIKKLSKNTKEAIKRAGENMRKIAKKAKKGGESTAKRIKEELKKRFKVPKDLKEKLKEYLEEKIKERLREEGQQEEGEEEEGEDDEEEGEEPTAIPTNTTAQPATQPPKKICNATCLFIKEAKIFKQSFCAFYTAKKSHTDFLDFRNKNETLKASFDNYWKVSLNFYDKLSQVLLELKSAVEIASKDDVIDDCKKGKLMQCNSNEINNNAFHRLKCLEPCSKNCEESDTNLKKTFNEAAEECRQAADRIDKMFNEK